MKELSIEEKAKRYDEAIERARYWEKNPTVWSSDDICQKLFPELKDSEDERIRKALLELINAYLRGNENVKIHDVYAKDMLAWLEKQGKQKPVFEIKTPEESLGIDSETYSKIVDECIYGEQKPTDKVEPRFKVGDTIKDPYGDTYHIIEIGNDSYKTDDGRFILFTNEKFYTLFNHAWSEEDETIKNNISHIIRQYDKISKKENQPCWYVGDCLLWVQNIKDRVIPQQNAVEENKGNNGGISPNSEWSEEDERILREIITIFDLENFEGYNIGKNNEDALKFLNSLKDRYTWKPSDKQMKALKEACDEHWEPDGLDPLYTLYQDLKKLMEE